MKWLKAIVRSFVGRLDFFRLDPDRIVIIDGQEMVIDTFNANGNWETLTELTVTFRRP
jgi:hypothetical protein